MTLIYNYDDDGNFINSQVALVDEFGKEILPENATYLKPLEEKEGYKVKFNGEKWIYEEIPQPKEPTLNELKEAKRAEINQARDEAEQGGFEYMGKVFDSDIVSCIRIQGAAQSMQAAIMAEEVPTITWTTKDNSTVELTAQELLGLSVSLAEWSNTCHQKATALKAQIDAAETAEELENITWEDKPAILS